LFYLEVEMFGCYEEFEFQVHVVPPPEADAGSDITSCGSPAIIGSTALPGFAYSWTPGTGLQNPLSSSTAANPSDTTHYILTVTNIAYGCKNRDTVLVYPVPVAEAGADRSLCLGEATLLGSPGRSGVDYSWSPASGLSDPLSPMPIASPTTSTVYTLSVSDGSCTVTDEVSITVKQPGTLEISEVPLLCMNECVELELSISGGNFNTFQWTPAASISAQNITNPVLCLSASSAVTVRAYDLASGCNAYDTIQVLVSTNPVPQAFAGNDTILCYGDDLTLGTPGQSGYFYQWYPPLFLNDPYLPQPQAVPAYSMTYSITVTDPSTSCSSSDEIEVEVYLIEAYASSYGTICYGSTTDLEAYAYGGASSVYAYEWAPAALVQDPGSGYTQASPLSTTTFSVTVTDIVSGCADSATTLVQVDQTPAPQVDLGPDLVICTAWGEADSLRIGIPPVPGYAYEWYPHGNLSDPYSSNPWFYHNYDDHFSYSLYVTDLNSQGDCSEGYDDIDITIRYSPSLYVSPDYAEVCEGQSVQLYGYLYNLPYGTAYEAKWQPASAVTNPTSLNTQALPKDPLTFLTLSVELKDDPQTDYRRCQVSNEVILVEYPDVSLTLNELVLDCGPASDRKLPLIVDPVVGWYYWEPSDLVINDYYVGSKDTTLTLHYNSIYGCDGSAPMKVHFGDKEPPLISCPPDALLECDEDTSVAALGEANCVDNCDSLPVISHLDRLLPGNCPQSYTIQRVWYASDSTGNLDSCIQIILMEDTEPPEIFCPGDVALICPADTSPGANGIATATDVCSAFSISYTDQVYADCGGSYTVERTWRATDDCGNYSECMQVLTVQ
ncbi:MAG TPA: hypothetical protein P5550_12260, partial [Bacteroidales bacterium]|nr:hypothetical protein [Bacteroidales bacterium]